MTVPGNDCPDCGHRLSGGACQQCGFTPSEAGTLACSVCRVQTPTAQLRRDPDRPERVRCGTCHMAEIRRRADQATEGPCGVPGCDKTTAQHIAETKQLLASRGWGEALGGKG